ncbi:hypothetical protein [Candidatus Palauibacter sp.]|uniref:hypothetical protein n=1 Tax=Candidatus Palauibacter sp. TaxID=3101350 RepID=UPI003C6F8F4C
MKTLTVRGVPAELGRALNEEKRRRGTSLNQTVLDLLKQSLGVGTPRSNGLGRFAGGWTDTQFREFEAATRDFGKIDPEMWE